MMNVRGARGDYDVPFCKHWDDKIPITKYGVDLIRHIGCASYSTVLKRLCDNCDIIAVEERLINAEQDLEDAKEQAKREERERVLMKKVNDIIYAIEENGEELSYELIMHELEFLR